MNFWTFGTPKSGQAQRKVLQLTTKSICLDKCQKYQKIKEEDPWEVSRSTRDQIGLISPVWSPILLWAYTQLTTNVAKAGLKWKHPWSIKWKRTKRGRNEVHLWLDGQSSGFVWCCRLFVIEYSSLLVFFRTCNNNIYLFQMNHLISIMIMILSIHQWKRNHYAYVNCTQL